MDISSTLPTLLGAAWLLPLASFVIIWLFGPRLGHAGKHAGYVATGAILGSFVLSLIALLSWTGKHGVFVEAHHDEPHAAATMPADAAPESTSPVQFRLTAAKTEADHEHAADEHAHHDHEGKTYYTGDWYTLAEFGKLRLTIGYYVDSLTVVMFCMVTLIASCIHFYAQGYMHDELHDIEDHEVTLSDGHHLHRRGRYHRFFQYLSLFCFSMLGIVVAGNLAMVFMFWELVGVCSYFLIGFYIERKSASTAANKAFIVNRVGDFGMLIGMMVLWSTLGTFNFGDMPEDKVAGTENAAGAQMQPGIFSQVRPGTSHELVVPKGMKQAATAMGSEDTDRCGRWLLIIAGVGIFCGCVGKSAQFPLHTWLPDAMEGPTPVSALVHSATMVAAGVYLAGRFYPVFAPEALLVIAVIGCITLFIAATIAITAVDIKRVLAYSTVSQLGYMMFALGVGGWVAGMLHLITHAFFKSLLFMCSGSVIHAVHTNDMTKMGGLRKKMPWTAYTMLVGCLAIAGAGIPFVVGFSGYYSKDSIIAQAIAYKEVNSLWGVMLFVAAGGASITAFYMFRLWYMTFAGQPRDSHKYDHAHESPKVMYYPLVLLSVFAVAVAWPVTIVGDAAKSSPLIHLLNQAVPDGVGSMEGVARGTLVTSVAVPSEHASHEKSIHTAATWLAFSTALGGFLLATVFYGWRYLDPAEVCSQFSQVYRFLWNKWWFDELYDALFVKPAHLLGAVAAWLDRNVLDRIIDGSAKVTLIASRYDDWFDRLFVDGLVNWFGRWTYGVGVALRRLQTGSVRQYAMFVVVGTVVLFVLLSFFLGTAAGR